MTDFYARLEHQLVDAASRRAAQAPLRRAAAGRGRAVAAVVACLVLVAGAVGTVRLSAGPGAAGPQSPRRANPTDPTQVPRIRLDGVSIAVLNGTATSGVARGVADDLQRQGATIAEVADAQKRTLARSVVGYRAGAEAAARRIARVLGISRVAPITGEDAAIAPAADVVVRVGHDRCGRRPSRCATLTPGVP